VDTFTAKWNRLGFNFRLTDFHAAIASTQLPKLPQRISKASKVYDLYLNLLSSADFIRVIPIDFANGEVGPYIEGELTTTDRNKFIAYMLHNQVDIRPFYPAICTAKYLNGTGDAPNARRFADNCIYLPSGPDITEDQIEYVCDLILAYPR
jgi:dTDP-4-amino-4,6-dideoxygalactose transaminase